VARHGEDYRFTRLKKNPMNDLTGKWQATFGLDKEKPYPAIGEFIQNGNDLSATFLTETGDYRYLHGTVQRNKLYLSCFDGAHAFLFEAKMEESGNLLGSFRSGNHYKTLWEAVRNDEASLKSPYQLTKMLDPSETFDFTFLSSSGKEVSLDDEAFNGKVKIVQIFGTWCPNCKDEMLFLVDYLNEKPNDNLEVIGLAFERYRDTTKVLDQLNTYKERLNIPYELLYAGPASKKEAIGALPMLNEIISYPTMIFLDENNHVVKIHTGFAGPATSTFETFVTEFNETIKELTAR
jgi:thiol-disulfide isomerase/thioredoxin